MTTQSFRCTECGMVFSNREQMEEHNKREHQQRQGGGFGSRTSGSFSGGSFRCPDCGMVFSSQEQMQEHSKRDHR